MDTTPDLSAQRLHTRMWTSPKSRSVHNNLSNFDERRAAAAQLTETELERGAQAVQIAVWTSPVQPVCTQQTQKRPAGGPVWGPALQMGFSALQILPERVAKFGA